VPEADVSIQRVIKGPETMQTGLQCISRFLVCIGLLVIA